MNPLAGVITILKANANIASATGGRVYGGAQIPGGKDKFPCVLIRRVGGRSPLINDAAEHELVIDIRCFAASQVAAQAVADSIVSAINGTALIEVSGWRLISSIEQVGPTDMQEIISDSEAWDSVFMTYRLALEEI